MKEDDTDRATADIERLLLWCRDNRMQVTKVSVGGASVEFAAGADATTGEPDRATDDDDDEPVLPAGGYYVRAAEARGIDPDRVRQILGRREGGR